MKKLTINVSGMHCASCQNNIQKSLSKVKGVKSADVELLQKKAFLEVEDDVSLDSLKKAVSSVGNYKVENFEFEDSASPTESMDSMDHNMQGHHHGTMNESEIETWKKKMIWSWVFVIPAIFLMYSERFFGLHIFSSTILTIVLLALSFPVVFIIGWATLKGGFKGLSHLYFNMDLLIALGTIISFLTGILQFFLPLKDYSGVSGMIMAIFITGKFVESTARGRAGKEIQKLLELGAKKAHVVRNGVEVEIDISEVKVGDIMVVKPGEKVPTDGIVIKGESSIDESIVTGESMPLEKKKGDAVIGATLNQDGVIYVKATKIGKDTFLSNVIKLVRSAQSSKIPIQATADKVTNIFVPTVLGISVLTFFGWFLFSGNPAISLAVAISVLVIACPCALGLATPTAIMVGSGIGAKHGILIRNGEAIQTMKEVKSIVFDKTGTITKGKPEVVEFYSKVPQKYFWEISASLEKNSEHPLSKAIVLKSGLKRYRSVSGFKNLRGRGVEGRVGSKEVVIGNAKLMQEKKIDFKKFEVKIKEFEEKGETTVLVSENKEVMGVIGIADSIKEDSKKIISRLDKLGLKIFMMTGDNQRTAEAIALKVGIKKENSLSNVLPEEKAKKVKELQKNGYVAFVGDGVNDAPALKQSNVGIALGTGTDIAIESGDIVLTNGSLEGALKAIKLSRATFGKIKQNLFWAFIYNTVAIPLAISGILSPVIAELAMAVSSITVVTNANLLRNKKI